MLQRRPNRATLQRSQRATLQRSQRATLQRSQRATLQRSQRATLPAPCTVAYAMQNLSRSANDSAFFFQADGGV
jgi:hypothetical protein